MILKSILLQDAFMLPKYNFLKALKIACLVVKPWPQEGAVTLIKYTVILRRQRNLTKDHYLQFMILLWSNSKNNCARTHLMTVGVISAQKKMLSVLTAWEENMPMMEKATENFRFRVSLRTVQRKKVRRCKQSKKTGWGKHF